MSSGKEVLIVPPNDPEAVLIYRLAKAIGTPVIVSHQPHGASLDRESDIVALVKAGAWKKAIVVEIPGPKTEAALRRAGVEVVIIDHHHYTGLDRAHGANGRILPSSLEQFLRMKRLTDRRLRSLGFDPKLVRGVGVMDRGFVWALREEGYSQKDILRVLAYQKDLMSGVRSSKDEARKDAIAQKAWESRKAWKVEETVFQVVQSQAAAELRPRISLIVALEIKKPTPLIIVEKKRGLIYVQESPFAMALFKQFGGFTFGLDRCWGWKNEPGKKQIGLRDVQQFLESQSGR